MSVIDRMEKTASVTEPRSNDWFDRARYGLFVHWGLYSLLGRGEWVRNREQIPADLYRALSDRFDARDFNADELAQLALKWGMRYGVLTTKHHDGFCLWNSSTCGFNAVRSAARRDLVGEFVEGFRRAGLKVGLYYSLGDWEHPDWARAVHGDTDAEQRFVEYTHTLVEELMTGYGPIDVLWYDLPQGLTATQWRAAELNERVREWQPGILINNRSLLAEDFSISEQHIQAPPPGRRWEACLTLNESWAYVAGDDDYKTPRDVARTLAKVAALNGNLLLNVGPDGRGAVPLKSRQILDEVGHWIERNGESVFCPATGSIPWNLWGQSLVSGNRLYLFMERYFGSELVIGGLSPQVCQATLLGSAKPLSIQQSGSQTVLRGLPEVAPDPVLTVIRLDLEGPADQSISRVIGGADIMARFPD